jgi:peptide/nickel transport system substrate-binding protein
MTNVIRLAALLVGSSIISISIPQAASAGKADDTLVVAMDDRIRAVDTIGETQLNLRMLGMLIDEQLFVYNPETKQNEHALAKSHNFVDDVTMDVELRENVKFHDGTVLSADDVVYTFDILLSSKSTAQYQRLSPWLDRVEKTGPMSVRFHLKQPYPFVTFDLASHAPIKKVGDIVVDGIADYENGLGPYTVVEFTPDEVVLERFEDYYEAGLKPAEIGKIRIRAIPDWGTQQAEIATGGVDLMWEIPNDIARNYDNHATIEHVSAPSLAWYFVMLNPEAERR